MNTAGDEDVPAPAVCYRIAIPARCTRPARIRLIHCHLVLKAKHKQNLRPAQQRAGNRNSRPAAARPFRWRLPLVILGAAALAAALTVEYWWPSAKRGLGFSSTSAVSVPAAPAQDTGDFRSRVNYGNELLRQGKASEAVAILRQAMQMKPEDEDVHYNLAMALSRVGKTDEAIQQYNEALRLFPNYAEAHNNLGNLLMRAGRTDEAIKHFEQALAIMPDDASAHNNLGTALEKSGRSEDALLQFQKAVKLNPDYWQAHFNLAAGYMHDRRMTDARSELETVLRLRPDFQPAKSALAALEAQLPPTAPSQP